MNQQTWTKLPAIKGQTACATCGCGSHDTLNLNAIIAVGFGDASVTCDGVPVYSDNQCQDMDDFWTCSKAEEEASKDPDRDWRIHFYAPLYEAHYQRHGQGHWVLIEKGRGFA